MRHGSLFSGIGGFDLAAEWMGWENVFHCEWNPFGQQVLKHHFPKSKSYEDITKTDFTIHRGDIDILTGGFPCQPYSSAGKRLGKEDERHLWPEMLRVIRETSPSYVVGENVRGLTNWNGGLVFDEVQADLEALGYEVLPFLLPACAVGAPHRRDRIWFIAYTDRNGNGPKHELCSGGYVPQECVNKSGDATDANYKRHKSRLSSRKKATDTAYGNQNKSFDEYFSRGWQEFPTQSPLCGRDDGFPTELDGITFSKWRFESIKAYGNAIVPQVALAIFEAIQAMQNLKHT
jgi:DNA (cytosine-5)-methyltransferase 1